MMAMPLILALFLWFCGMPAEPQMELKPARLAVASVTVSPDSVTLQVGDVGRATCTPRNKFGAVLTDPCVWVSRDTTVVTAVSGTQVTSLTARKVGLVWVRGASSGKGDSIRVRVVSSVVTPPPPPPPDTTTPPAACGTRVVNVATMAALSAALAAALPGDCILLAAGTYGLTGGLTIGRSGTATDPIVIQGPGSSAVLDVNQQLVSLRASHVRLRKFRMTDFPGMGLWIYGATGLVLDSMELDHSGHELLAMKDASHHNTIKNSWFHDSGILVPSFGEGIYISNWGGTGFPLQFTNTDNQILNNRFGPNVRSEGIDLKEGADRTIIRGNSFDGTGAPPGTGSGALIAVISSNNLIDGNTLKYGRPDGIDFYAPRTVTMVGNVVSNNTVDLHNIFNVTRPEGRWAFWLTANTNSTSHVVIKCNNAVTNLMGGFFSNVACTP